DVNLAGWNGTASNSNPQQVIAVIDSGIDYDHPDLNGVMADMSAYSALGFGKYGVNLVSEDTVYDSKTPMDEYLHGTHVAGIIAAEWNGQGTSGIANGVKLVSIKVGGKNSSSIAAALKGYELLARAMGQGLDLVATNNSYGSSGGSAKMLSIAVAKLGELGAVSAFASGNDGVDVDKLPNIVNG
ncbi:MAG: S8 family serine peptidase, partial [Raoultibacter sp.]